jgi:hypothetical protein
MNEHGILAGTKLCVGNILDALKGAVYGREHLPEQFAAHVFQGCKICSLAKGSAVAFNALTAEALPSEAVFITHEDLLAHWRLMGKSNLSACLRCSREFAPGEYDRCNVDICRYCRAISKAQSTVGTRSGER